MDLDLKYIIIVRIACVVFSLTALQLQFIAHAVDVVTDRNGTCENESCIVFQEMLLNTNKYFTSDSSIRFSPGNYSVEQQTQVIAKDINNLSLLSTSSSHNQLQSVTFINCNENLSFVFFNVTNLQIVGLTFEKCGLEVPAHIIPSVILAYYARLSPLYAAVFLAYVKNLTVTNVNIVNSQGYGILALSVHGKSTIEKLQLLGNAQQATSTLHKPTRISPELVNCFFGNAWFIFDDSSTYPATDHEVQKLLISSVQISWIASYYECADIFHNHVQTGLGFQFLQKKYPMELDMNGIDFISGSLSIKVHATANSTIFSLSNSTVSTTASYSFGSSILASDKWIDQHLPSKHEFKVTNCQFIGTKEISHLHHLDLNFFDKITNVQPLQSIHIFVENCSFSSSSIRLSTPTTCESKLDGILNITQCVFADWRALTSTSIKLSFANSTNPCFSSIFVKSCQFNSGEILAGSTSVTTLEISDTITYKAVILTSMTNVIIADTIFQLQNTTALTLLGSTVYFKGENTFSNNHGSFGGAIALEPYNVPHTDTLMFQQSFLYFYPHAHLYIFDNTAASVGGGIYIKELESSVDTRLPCFYQVANWNGIEDVAELDIKIVMENNSAQVAGDSIFGGLNSLCYLTHNSLHTKTTSSSNAFDILFDLQNPMSSSELAAAAQQVCVCHPDTMNPACDSLRVGYQYLVYPGQTFKLPAVTLGSNLNFHVTKHGAVPNVVLSSVTPSSRAQLGQLQEVQHLPRSCGNLTFTVFSAEESVALTIYVPSIEKVSTSLSGITFYIQLLPCPLGFELKREPPGCECMQLLIDNNCKCTINETLTYTCPERFWIGRIIPKGVLYYSRCPFHYCTSDWEGPHGVDSQCANNHSGILCGMCKPGYSLALKTSHCLPHCSNIYILLIIPIALAGLLLVAFLLICNLTVSTGTINGLIYFANIVGFNNKTFFPNSDNSFLSVFISWLNLDLGIETCFYPRMDMYAKTWLQFLFPFYIWAIIFIIIISSHYSVLVTKLTRSNAVPVLATLLRLSYAKVLHTIITALSFTYLKSLNGTQIAVWLYDGNVPFSSGRHIALVLFAILTLLLLVFPYTILLLLSPFLQAKASHRRLRLVNKMKPFLDAYHGPYRDKFRNWTGVMLLVQMLQFLAFACNSLGDPNINLLVIATTSAGLLTLSWSLGLIYRKKILNTLESLFFLALTVLAVASLYIGAVSDQVKQARNQRMATFIIVGATFVLFTMIFIYHAFALTRSLLSSFTIARNKDASGNDIELDGLPQNEYIQPQHPPSCSSIELREPLLDLQS